MGEQSGELPVSLVYCPHYTCPRCLGRTKDCCACHGAGVLTLQGAFVRAMQQAWAIDDCTACRVNGRGPK